MKRGGSLSYFGYGNRLDRCGERGVYLSEFDLIPELAAATEKKDITKCHNLELVEGWSVFGRNRRVLPICGALIFQPILMNIFLYV